MFIYIAWVSFHELCPILSQGRPPLHLFNYTFTSLMHQYCELAWVHSDVTIHAYFSQFGQLFERPRKKWSRSDTRSNHDWFIVIIFLASSLIFSSVDMPACLSLVLYLAVQSRIYYYKDQCDKEVYEIECIKKIYFNL